MSNQNARYDFLDTKLNYFPVKRVFAVFLLNTFRLL